MKKSLAVIALTFTLGACSLTPPPPAEAVDDGLWADNKVLN